MQRELVRDHLTGISFGGGLGYQLAYENPTRFAAFVPISSVYSDAGITSNPSAAPDSSYPLVAQRLKAIAVWVHEGFLDPVMGAARGIVSALQAAGGNVRYTEYPGIGHDSSIWDDVYASADFYTCSTRSIADPFTPWWSEGRDRECRPFVRLALATELLVSF